MSLMSRFTMTMTFPMRFQKDHTQTTNESFITQCQFAQASNQKQSFIDLQKTTPWTSQKQAPAMSESSQYQPHNEAIESPAAEGGSAVTAKRRTARRQRGSKSGSFVGGIFDSLNLGNHREGGGTLGHRTTRRGGKKQAKSSEEGDHEYGDVEA